MGCRGRQPVPRVHGGRDRDGRVRRNQYALSPTDDFGYWQINASNGSLATYNALGNARSAIILSDDGTNWSPWTTYTAGLYVGRC